MNPARQRPAERTAPETRKQSVYEEIIARFIAQGVRSAQVSVESINTATLRAGLRRELKDVDGVRLAQRGAETYLIRLTAPKR